VLRHPAPDQLESVRKEVIALRRTSSIRAIWMQKVSTITALKGLFNRTSGFSCAGQEIVRYSSDHSLHILGTSLQTLARIMLSLLKRYDH